MEWALGWDVVGRLVVAMVAGALIGVEREVSDHSAGLRTHASVSLGAAAFGVVSTMGFTEIVAPAADTNLRADVTRVASQVVVGIGFLGAGLIFRRGGSIRNLTTAASLWVTAAVGLAAGVGDPGVALVTTGLMIGVLVALRGPQRWFVGRLGRSRARVTLTIGDRTEPEAVRDLVEGTEGLDVDRWRVENHEGRLVVEADLAARTDVMLDDRIGILARSPTVADLRQR